MGATERQLRQRDRLERLSDVVYGVVIVLLVANMPTPSSAGLEGASITEFLASVYEVMIASAIALIMVVSYWIQSNAITGILTHTDDRHSSLSIGRLVMMLAYFYATGLSEEFAHPRALLAAQSAALALVGAFGILTLAYAAGRGGLVQEDVGPSELRTLRFSLLPEPLTALVTLPVAFFGVDAWSLAWLSYPLLALAVNRVAASGTPASGEGHGRP